LADGAAGSAAALFALPMRQRSATTTAEWRQEKVEAMD
jgi:hypothetical protein